MQKGNDALLPTRRRIFYLSVSQMCPKCPGQYLIQVTSGREGFLFWPVAASGILVP